MEKPKHLSTRQIVSWALKGMLVIDLMALAITGTVKGCEENNRSNAIALAKQAQAKDGIVGERSAIPGQFVWYNAKERDPSTPKTPLRMTEARYL